MGQWLTLDERRALNLDRVALLTLKERFVRGESTGRWEVNYSVDGQASRTLASFESETMARRYFRRLRNVVGSKKI